MYYPYLRGRQFELLAIRELSMQGLLSDKVIPIVEPVKASPTLLSAIEAFQSNSSSSKKQIAVVLNPVVGSLEYDITKMDSEPREKFLSKFNKIQQTAISAYIAGKELKIPKQEKSVLQICLSPDVLQCVLDNKDAIDAVLIPDDRAFRRGISIKKKILLSDRFNIQERNVDYLKNEDEFFSDDHLFFEEENYSGFSDYSIIGSGYKESGFAPYAVAFHMVYFDSEKKLRVHHFVSDSNDDMNNPAGKFAEALNKLKCFEEWENPNNRSHALDLFSKLKSYPGLGKAKQLSIMHHIELMDRFLNGGVR
jgi:hypothetical protein